MIAPTNSRIYQMFQANHPDTRPFDGACVLGDSGYENYLPWLVTPYPGKIFF